MYWKRFSGALLTLFLLLGLFPDSPAWAQETVIARVEADLASNTIEVGETISFTVTAFDREGEALDDVEFRIRAPRSALEVGEGTLKGLQPGEYEVVASVFPSPDLTWPGDSPPSVTIPVTVTWPAVDEVDVQPEGEAQLYAGTTLKHQATGYHADGSERTDPSITWRSSDPGVASVDRFGNVTAHTAGTVDITAEIDGVRGTATYDIAPFPGDRIVIEGGGDEARTGDVLDFRARVLDENGQELDDVPVTWSTTFIPSDSVGAHAGAGGQVYDDGTFVAEHAGEHTVLATAGPLAARQSVEVQPRRVLQGVRQVGQGRINDQHTSDIWAYEGTDGRDYAITGTWGSDGHAFFWDITDPSNIVKYDSIQVDARTINDVKVSPDGRYGVLTREGASNRRNGVVIIDLSDPQNPSIASTFTEGLTGGVHNAFATNEYLFALSAGEKFVILDVRDIENPQYAGEYDHPDARIHDIHVEDGIAYTSQWGAGVVVVDVGNGQWGGSPEEPVFVTSFTTPGGRTHAAFPYQSESTDRFYLFLGDEILHRRGRALGAAAGRTLHTQPYDPENDSGGAPSMTAGYIHVVDFTDPDDPELVARYEVPEYGTHNLWVKDDVLYQAYYEGGTRMVDVSGELRGNLARQGREMAIFKSHDPNGYIANAPMVWTALPYKGNIFFSDWNSGVWAIEMAPLD